MSETVTRTSGAKLAEILNRDYGRLLRFVKYRLNGGLIQGQDAEDVVSDVVLRLLERADLVAEIEDLTAYILTALANGVSDLFRRKRDQSLEETKEADLPASPRDDETLLALDQALSLLSDAERAVWMAVELDGYTFRQLAEMWGEPIGTLLSRKSRATRHLRQAMDGLSPAGLG